MVDLSTLKAGGVQSLSPGAIAELAAHMLGEIKQLGEQADRDAQTIRFKDAKLEKITFELARLKALKFGAHTERLNAEQRQMFETTAAEDEADLAAQLAALQGDDKQTADTTSSKPKTQPRPPARASTRLTVATQTPHVSGDHRLQHAPLARSTMTSAFAGSIDRGERAGLDEASADAASPRAGYRPSHVRPLVASRHVGSRLQQFQTVFSHLFTISRRPANLNRACLWC